MTTLKNNTPVAQNIKRLIIERGLKQYTVAKQAGYKPQQLSDMINGRKLIKSCDIVAIAKTMEVSIEELFAPL